MYLHDACVQYMMLVSTKYVVDVVDVM